MLLHVVERFKVTNDGETLELTRQIAAPVLPSSG
jgi:hypothetical protein